MKKDKQLMNDQEQSNDSKEINILGEREGKSPWLVNILDAIHEGVVVVDLASTIIYANPSYGRRLGVTVERVLGKKIKEIEPTSRILDVLHTGQPVVDDPSRIVSLNMDIVANIAPIYKKEKLTGAVAVFRDMSEVLSLQEKLLETAREMERAKALTNRYYFELQELRARLLEVGDVVFESPEMRRVMELVFRLAQVDSTVLITGESGVGKEVVTKLIHRASKRKQRAFVVVNCGAIPQNLLESELFGYEKGAFTGANKEGKIGLLEVANKGTVFLDEISEMPLNLQVKLLRVIQEQSFTRVGGINPVEIDVRFVAAANKDLKSMVEKDQFREDLYYRLNVVPIAIPPLRQRNQDIIPLTRYFLERYNQRYGLAKKIHAKVLSCFESLTWPGNVRELENIVERLVVSSATDLITLEDETFQEYLQQSAGKRPLILGDVLPWKTAKEMLERELLAKALSRSGSTRGAARLLGVDHSTVARKLKKYDLNE